VTGFARYSSTARLGWHSPGTSCKRRESRSGA
jgi:hypothetical protein